MSNEHYAEFQRTGRMPATGETFTSPTQSFSESYDGTLVKFTLRPGTISQLEGIGVRDTSAITEAVYPDMPTMSGRWTRTSAYFKGEGQQINIGLGRGSALNIFNDNITGYEEIPR